jgi:hypothetical protein
MPKPKRRLRKVHDDDDRAIETLAEQNQIMRKNLLAFPRFMQRAISERGFALGHRGLRGHLQIARQTARFR